MKKLVIILTAVFLLSECSTVPITGRKRINLVSDAQVLPASFAQYSSFLDENKLSTNREMTNQIKNVGKNISAAVDRFMRANNMVEEARKGNDPLCPIKGQRSTRKHDAGCGKGPGGPLCSYCRLRYRTRYRRDYSGKNLDTVFYDQGW